MLVLRISHHARLRSHNVNLVALCTEDVHSTRPSSLLCETRAVSRHDSGAEDWHKNPRMLHEMFSSALTFGLCLVRGTTCLDGSHVEIEGCGSRGGCQAVLYFRERWLWRLLCRNMESKVKLFKSCLDMYDKCHCSLRAGPSFTI